MTPEQTAACTMPAVTELGGAFSEDPQTLRRARQLGLSSWAFYVAGRGGALGDVRPDTVAAVLGLIAPEAVYDGWDAALRVGTPAEIAKHHLAECLRWGDEHLAGYPGVGRIVELAERVVVTADAAGMPLFAAWRAMPVPECGVGARAAVLLHLMHEHRAGAQLLAVRASGLSPLEAIISGPEGEAGAVTYGWQPPYPPIGPLVRRRVWAEAVAEKMAAQAYRALDPPERGELVVLLDGALAAVRGGSACPART